jgi:hypothetical protein
MVAVRAASSPKPETVILSVIVELAVLYAKLRK